GIAVDSAQQRIYVTDTLRNQGYVLDVHGSVLQVIGKTGSGNGEFNYPTELRLNGQDLVVVDAMNFRVQVLSRSGEFKYAIGQIDDSVGGMFRPRGSASILKAISTWSMGCGASYRCLTARASSCTTSETAPARESFRCRRACRLTRKIAFTSWTPTIGGFRSFNTSVRPGRRAEERIEAQARVRFGAGLVGAECGERTVLGCSWAAQPDAR